MLWALAALSAIELGVVHTLLAVLWSGTAALIASLVTLAGLTWLVRLLLATPKRPVLLYTHHLTLRVGTLHRVEIAVEDIAGVRTAIDSAALRDRAVLNMALLAHPNVIVDLVGPLPGRRAIRSVAHCLDDAAAFVRAVEALGSRA